MKTMSIFRMYSGFCDLNIGATQDFIETCQRLIELNYKVIALNQVIGTNTAKKKVKEPNEVVVPPPLKMAVPEQIQKKLKILNRLTIVASDPSYLQWLAYTENFDKYHLIALAPQTEEVFQYACTSKFVDIISFGVHEANALLMLNRKLYNLVVDQNIYFELPYARAVDTTNVETQQNVIRIAHKYCMFGKSKNVIVTSGAKNSYDIIGPYSVIALGLIFHMTDEQMKSALARNCENLLHRAGARRLQRAGKALESASEEENEKDNVSKANNHCDTKFIASEDESHVDYLPKVKRHCVGPQMKSAGINKDMKT